MVCNLIAKFNKYCKVMNVGPKCETRYFLHDPINNSLEQLEHTNFEKDLGDWINNDLKWSENCGKAIKKAMSVLGMINRTFNAIDCHTCKILYKAYVRPHLEYCIQACSPYFKKNINCLECPEKSNQTSQKFEKPAI